MKTNKACPKYVEELFDLVSQPLTVAMTEKDEEELLEMTIKQL